MQIAAHTLFTQLVANWTIDNTFPISVCMSTPGTSPDSSIPGASTPSLEADVATQSSGVSRTSTNGVTMIYFILVIIGAIFLLFVLARLLIRNKEEKIQQDDNDDNGRTYSKNQDLEANDKNAAEGDSNHRAPPCKKRRIMMILPSIFAVIAFSLSVVSNISCRFISIGDGHAKDLLSVGAWSVSYSYDYVSINGIEMDVCYSTFPPDFVYDATFKLARASVVLASMFGGEAMLILLLSFGFTKCSWLACLLRRTGWLFLVAALCQGLALSLLNSGQCSENNSACSLGNSGVGNIIGIGYWTIAALAMLLVPSQ